MCSGGIAGLNPSYSHLTEPLEIVINLMTKLDLVTKKTTSMAQGAEKANKYAQYSECSIIKGILLL